MELLRELHANHGGGRVIRLLSGSSPAVGSAVVLKLYPLEPHPGLGLPHQMGQLYMGTGSKKLVSTARGSIACSTMATSAGW